MKSLYCQLSDGDRYPLKYEVDASGVEQAIELATAKAAPLHISKENLTIMSVSLPVPAGH
jgi:hypothetical protein